jgi:hypothetical protein
MRMNHGRRTATAVHGHALQSSREKQLRRIELTVHTSNQRAMDV